MARRRRRPPWEEFRTRAALFGRVVDAATRDPVEGALVRLSERPDSVPDSRAVARTDRSGHYHFVNLPPGPYELTAALPGTGSRFGTAVRKVRLRRRAADVPPVALELELPSTRVEGVVRDAESRPVAGAAIVSAESRRRATSGEDGRFVLTAVEAGSTRLLVSAPGFEAQPLDISAPEQGSASSVEVSLSGAAL